MENKANKLAAFPMTEQQRAGVEQLQALGFKVDQQQRTVMGAKR
jgi:hypothetical protein